MYVGVNFWLWVLLKEKIRAGEKKHLQPCRAMGYTGPMRIETQREGENMNKIGFSIYIPYWVYLHAGTGKGITVSRRCAYNWLAHYGSRRRSMGRSEKNVMGVWCHFDSKGRCVGYSKRRLLLFRHFDKGEKPVGFTVNLGILRIHFLKKQRNG